MSRATMLFGLVIVFGLGCGGSKPSASSASGPAPASVSASASVASGCPSGAVAVDGGSFSFAATTKPATVKPHCLDRTEVTTSAYAACVQKGACTEPLATQPEGYKKACNWNRTGSDDHPVNCVDFAQARAYCAFVKGRLPTEAEWEWSARGYAKGWIFPWGEEKPSGRACFDDDALEDSPETTCKVGSFPTGANPKGVLDLSGNVWEWTTSEGVVEGGKAIDRGGSWVNGDVRRLTAGFRNDVDAKGQWPSVGFRCAYDL